MRRRAGWQRWDRPAPRRRHRHRRRVCGVTGCSAATPTAKDRGRSHQRARVDRFGRPMPRRLRRRRLASFLPDVLLRRPLAHGRRGGGAVSGSSGTPHLLHRPTPRCPMWTHRPSRGSSDPRPSWALSGESMGGGIAVSGRGRAWTRRPPSRLPRDAVRGFLPGGASARRPHLSSWFHRSRVPLRDRWLHRDDRLHRNRPIRANRHLRRSSIVLGRLDCDGVSGLRSRRGCPVWSPIGRRSHRSRGPILLQRVMRPATVGRRWLSRHCRPRRDRLGSSGELLSLGARERDSRRTWGRTWGVAPTCGAAAVLVVRARPQSVGTAAHWVARVIAHPIRPSPALAFPRSRLSGVPGPGGRRFARLLDDVSRSGAAWEAALGEQICGQHSSGVAAGREGSEVRRRYRPPPTYVVPHLGEVMKRTYS